MAKLRFLSIAAASMPLIVALVSYLNRGCPSQYVCISGSLSEAHVQAVREAPVSKKGIRINSGGGSGMIALSIAREIEDRAWELEVKGQCSSACAEFLMPAAKVVKLRNYPIITLHGNPVVLQELFDTSTFEYPAHCPHQQYEGLAAIYRNSGANIEFARAQARLLRVTKFEVVYNSEGCPLTRHKMQVAFWFPTSDQMREDWKLNIEGQVCADRQECIDRVLSRRDGSKLCIFGTEERRC